jgi:hypothetical protein
MRQENQTEIDWAKPIAVHVRGLNLNVPATVVLYMPLSGFRDVKPAGTLDGRTLLFSPNGTNRSSDWLSIRNVTAPRQKCPDCNGEGTIGEARDGRLIACETCGGHEDAKGCGYIEVEGGGSHE